MKTNRTTVSAYSIREIPHGSAERLVSCLVDSDSADRALAVAKLDAVSARAELTREVITAIAAGTLPTECIRVDAILLRRLLANSAD